MFMLDRSICLHYYVCMKKTTQSVLEASSEIGEHLKTWRKIYQLKSTQVAQRAGISAGTLRKLENGDPSVSAAALLEVARSLGLLETLSNCLDPLNTDLGRARVNERLPKRVR